MANKFQKSIYIPKNPQKYIGKRAIICRSSWERTFCIFCDNHPNIINWISEPFGIPYHDVITNRQKLYWPDFLIIYIDINGVRCGEIIEIKPENQTGIRKTKSKINNAQAIRNHCKWNSALAYCAKNGLKFRLLTEAGFGFKGTKR